MGIQIAGFTVANIAEVDATSKALRVIQYDSNGNVQAPVTGATANSTLGYQPVSGLDGGKIIRAMRVGEHGTQKVTSEVLMWHDAFESATINAFWTQSLTTMTAVQATGVLTLNNSGITTLNTAAIITSLRQSPKYPRQPLFARFRANISANVAGNHTLVEMGFGAPVGVTAIINNGAFFRWRTDGTLAAVISYNGTEHVTQVLAQGVISTANYYYYDIIVDDDFVRFIVTDAAGIPIVDQQISTLLTSPNVWAVSHLPTFARVYVDSVGGGTAVKLLLAAHSVQILDSLMTKPWPDQMVATMRHASINPTTYAQTCTLANAGVPAAVTPSNTTVTNATLGGEFNCLATAGGETILSVFGFTIPTPYTFYLKGLYISLPLVQGAAVVTATVLEWFVAPNASSTNLSTATGLQRIPIGNFMLAAGGAAIGTTFTGTPIIWTPKVPIACLPGTILHIGYKSITGAATASLAYRGICTVDGHFE
jgi:hypothetical protein